MSTSIILLEGEIDDMVPFVRFNKTLPFKMGKNLAFFKRLMWKNSEFFRKKCKFFDNENDIHNSDKLGLNLKHRVRLKNIYSLVLEVEISIY